MFRVIIAGSRNFSNYPMLKSYADYMLSNVKDDILILCGQAAGADTLGERYANEKGYQLQYFPADWKKYGKSAGFRRNVDMAQNADALIAFWDGKSHGTKHMIAVAQKYHLKIRVKKF